MKAITLHRPWDWAMAHGGKCIENRSWRPRSVVGQRIALHASHTYDEMGADFIRRIYGPLTMIPQTPGGVIVATTFIAGWVGPAADIEPRAFRKSLSAAAATSPWFFGPIGWVCRETRALPEPIPCRGGLGLWTVPAQIALELQV